MAAGGQRPAAATVAATAAAVGADAAAAFGQPFGQLLETGLERRSVIFGERLLDPQLERHGGAHHERGEERNFVLAQHVDRVDGGDEKGFAAHLVRHHLVAQRQLGRDRADHRRLHVGKVGGRGGAARPLAAERFEQHRFVDETQLEQMGAQPAADQLADLHTPLELGLGDPPFENEHLAEPRQSRFHRAKITRSRDLRSRGEKDSP